MKPAVVSNKEISKFGSNVLKLISGKIAGQIIAILAMPLITRLYSPNDFGIFQVFASITAVIIVVSSLRYDLAIMLPEKDDEAVNILALSGSIVGFISIISLICVIFFRDYVATVLNVPELSFYLWFAPLAILTGGILNVFRYWSSRRQEFSRLAIAGVSSSISNTAVKMILGLIGRAGPGGLIGANIVGSIIGTIVLVGRGLLQDWSFFKENISMSKMKYWAIRYKKFPIYSSWSGLLNSVYFQLPAFMLAFYFSPTIVGFYALGYKVVKAPMTLIGETVGRVFFQKASEEKNKYGTSSNVVEAVFSRLVAIGFFPMLVFTLLGEDLFSVVFGANWSEAGYYMQLLAPWLFFIFISSPISTIFSVIEKQYLDLAFDAIKFISTLSVLIIGGLTGDPRLTIILLGITGVLIRGSLCFWMLSIAGLSVYKSAKYFWMSLLFSMPFLVMILISKGMELNIIYEIAFALIGGLIYLLFIINKDRYLKNLLVGIIRPNK